MLRPVEAGYERMRRIVFLGSIMKTERIVNAMPLESTFVMSWWSSLQRCQLGQMRNGKTGQYSHVIEICNGSLLITNDWEAQLAARNLINVLDPSSVGLDRVGRKTDQLDATLGELGLQLCEGAQLGGADGCVVFWVGEQDNPLVANKLVEVDWALGGFGLEVGCKGSQAEAIYEDRDVSKSTVQITRNNSTALPRDESIYSSFSRSYRPCSSG